MLKIGEPIQLKCKNIITGVSSFIAERIEWNYRFFYSKISAEELLHLSLHSPEGLDNEGFIEIINQFLNRIVLNKMVLDKGAQFTYQDQVFISCFLNKLGIYNVTEFMTQFRLECSRQKNNIELARFYKNIKTIKKQGENESLVGLEKISYIQDKIYERLNVVENIGALSANLVLEKYKEYADEVRIMQMNNNLSLENGLFDNVSQNYYAIKYYESDKMTKSKAQANLIGAILLDVLGEIHYKKINNKSGHPDLFIDTGKVIFETAKNTIDCFDSYGIMSKYTAKSYTEYKSKFNEISNFEIEFLKEYAAAFEEKRNDSRVKIVPSEDEANKNQLVQSTSIDLEYLEFQGQNFNNAEELKKYLDYVDARNKRVHREVELYKEQNKERFEQAILVPDKKSVMKDALRAILEPQKVLAEAEKHYLQDNADVKNRFNTQRDIDIEAQLMVANEQTRKMYESVLNDTYNDSNTENKDTISRQTKAAEQLNYIIDGVSKSETAYLQDTSLKQENKQSDYEGNSNRMKYLQEKYLQLEKMQMEYIRLINKNTKQTYTANQYFIRQVRDNYLIDKGSQNKELHAYLHNEYANRTDVNDYFVSKHADTAEINIKETDRPDSRMLDSDSKIPDSDSKIPDSDSKIPDSRMSDLKILDSDFKILDLNMSDLKMSDSKILDSDSKMSDLKILDLKIPDSDSKRLDLNMSDLKMSDSKILDSKILDSKMSDPDSKILDLKMSDLKMSDSKILDLKMSDSKILDSDSKILDLKMSDSKILDSKILDSKIPDSDLKILDSKILDSKIPDSDSKILDSKILDSKILDSKMPDSDSKISDSTRPDLKRPDLNTLDTNSYDEHIKTAKKYPNRISDSDHIENEDAYKYKEDMIHYKVDGLNHKEDDHSYLEGDADLREDIHTYPVEKRINESIRHDNFTANEHRSTPDASNHRVGEHRSTSISDANNHKADEHRNTSDASNHRVGEHRSTSISDANNHKTDEHTSRLDTADYKVRENIQANLYKTSLIHSIIRDHVQTVQTDMIVRDNIQTESINLIYKNTSKNIVENSEADIKRQINKLENSQFTSNILAKDQAAEVEISRVNHSTTIENKELIDEIVQKNLQTQVKQITEQVYGKIEKRISNERKRRGY